MDKQSTDNTTDELFLNMYKDIIEGPLYLTAAKSGCGRGSAYTDSSGRVCICVGNSYYNCQ